MTAQTCPGPRKARTRCDGDSRIALMAGGTSACGTRSEKWARPAARACQTHMAWAGAVVSKPMPKNTTCLSGCARASFNEKKKEKKKKRKKNVEENMG